MVSKKEIAWRKILGQLQRCKCKCPFRKKGYCHNEALYTQFLHFEPSGTVTFCKMEITEDGIMSVEVKTCQ